MGPADEHFRCGRRWLLVALLIGLGPAPASSLEARPRVVELFTSEGCSSCPPADAYLARLVDRKDVLALAFHVDYWDSLGWRDRFALPEAVQRQEHYAHTLGRSSVYTPQFVIDGVSDGVPGRFPVRPSGDAPMQAMPLQVRGSSQGIEVEIGAGPGPSRSAEVLLLSYAARAVSAVGRGENAGRTLQHANVVRSLQVLGTWSGAARRFVVSRNALPPDATDLAILVQLDGQGEIIAGIKAPVASLAGPGKD